MKVATALRDKLAPVAADLLGCAESELEWANNRVGVTGDRARAVTMAELSRTAEARDVMPYSHETFTAQSGEFDAETGRGQTYPDYTHGCHAVDVEVDERTGEVKILKYVAVHDVGRAIDMQRVEGQIQGAVAQGIGYALQRGDGDRGRGACTRRCLPTTSSRRRWTCPTSRRSASSSTWARARSAPAASASRRSGRAARRWPAPSTTRSGSACAACR